MYRIPNTNERLSIDRYETIADNINQTNIDTITGTDQNFDYLKLGSNKNTDDLLDTLFSVGMLPTINKPTRITHTSATLIDNIYIKCNNYGKFNSGILMNDISDYRPMCVCMGTKQKVSKKPLTIKCRKLDDDNINEISRANDLTDWTSLESLPIDTAFDFLITNCWRHLKQRKYCILKYNKRSSKARFKLYRAQINKPKNYACLTKYVKFRNLFNKLKKLVNSNTIASC